MKLFALTLSLLLGAACIQSASAQRGPRGDDRRDPRRGQREACFFENDNFTGRRTCFQEGFVMTQLPKGLNDSFSSAMIPPGMRVIAYEHLNFTGASVSLSGMIPSLTLYTGARFWNDRITSLDLR